MSTTNRRRLLAIVLLFFVLNACSLFTGAVNRVTPQPGGSTIQPDQGNPASNLPTIDLTPVLDVTVYPTAIGTVALPPETNVISCDPAKDLKPTRDSLGDPYYPQLGNGGYDAQHYILEITSDLGKGIQDGKTTLQAKATADLDTFSLDLRGLTVQEVTVDGKPAKFQRKEPELTITPAERIQKNRTFEVVVTYDGMPKPIDEGVGIVLGWNNYQDGSYVASEPAGALTWYPVSDHPCDKATYTLRITVPKPLEVAANGLLKDTLDNGNTRTFVWEETRPMASYLVTVNIGEFREETQAGPNGLPIRNFYQKDVSSEISRYFRRTPEMIDFYSSIFGPYPFEAYGVVVVGTTFGFALETQTLSLFSKDSLSTQDRGETVPAHELAHQWFGDSVSLKNWKDIWLNEGFATYSSWLWLEHLYGRPVLDDQVREWYHQMTGSDEPPPGDPSPDRLFTASVYFRAAIALHDLRLTVGDEIFFKILRTYADRYRYGNASTQDFIALAEEVSQQDLKDFFQGWLYEKQMPPIPKMNLKP